jgi:ankyrin repeat protein
MIVYRNGSTPLHYAAGKGDVQQCRFLLQQQSEEEEGGEEEEYEYDDNEIEEAPAGTATAPKTDHNERHYQQHQHQHQQRRRRRRSTTRRRRVDAASTKDSRTPLHWAARNGQYSVVQMLIEEYGATIAPSAHGNVTPLQLAVWQGHVPIVQYLMAQQIQQQQQKRQQLQITTSSTTTSSNNNNDNNNNLFQYNDWGCHLGHWLGKSPIYAEAMSCVTRTKKKTTTTGDDGDDDDVNDDDNDAGRCGTDIDSVRKRLIELCEWLDKGVAGGGIRRRSLSHSLSYSSSVSAPSSLQYQFWIQQNHQGQTPLHKAGYSGNIPLCEYMVFHHAMIDSVYDRHGNTAADCAERGQQHGAALWLRKYASSIVHESVHGLSSLASSSTTSSSLSSDTDPPSRSVSRPPMKRGGLRFRPIPSLSTIRNWYKRLVKIYHPDRWTKKKKKKNDDEDDDTELSTTWDTIQLSYTVLTTWWIDPIESDIQLRTLSRQSYLQHVPLLLWTKEWHTTINTNRNPNPNTTKTMSRRTTIPMTPSSAPTPRQNHTKTGAEGDDTPAATITTTPSSSFSSPSLPNLLEERLRGFEMNLLRLLSTVPNHCIRMAQLRKEYRKAWMMPTPSLPNHDVALDVNDNSTNHSHPQPQHTYYDVPNPREYRCKKLSHVLKKYCSNSVEIVLLRPPPSSSSSSSYDDSTGNEKKDEGSNNHDGDDNDDSNSNNLNHEGSNDHPWSMTTTAAVTERSPAAEGPGCMYWVRLVRS